jgi:hypothetical protein
MEPVVALRLEDDPALVDVVRKNGYYQVGSKNYNYKINALEEATRTRQPLQWDFNHDVYSKLNWKQSTGVGLDNLYRIRAQQLRDQYDYLVLAFSGGADSYNVLRSFLDNNIKLDEIICDWPLQQTERQSINRSDRPENYLNEWNLAIKPVLQQVAQDHPEITITVTDSLCTLTDEDQEDTCTVTQIHNYVSIKRYRLIGSRLKQLQQQHKNVALILGIEKPEMYIKYNVFCVYFTDTHCWYKSSCQDYQRNIEYFYWSPTLPEIVLEQAHVVYKYLQQNPQLIPWFKVNEELRDTIQQRLHSKIIRDTTRSLLYSTWNPQLFQADKGNSLIYNEQYEWFFAQEKTREIQSWESSMHSRLNLVDPKYLNYFEDGRFKGYRPMSSKLYTVGVVEN